MIGSQVWAADEVQPVEQLENAVVMIRTDDAAPIAARPAKLESVSPDAAPSRTLSWLTPTAAISVVAVEAPMPLAEVVSHDGPHVPTSPSSLTLLAVGLAFLALARARHWVVR